MIIEDTGFDGDKLLYPEPQLVIPRGSFEGTPQELAQVILDQIETYPETFDMGCWIEGRYAEIQRSEEEIPAHRMDKLKAVEATPACGTTLCIAGYAQLFVDGKIGVDVARRAQDLLGLKSNGLFFAPNEIAEAILKQVAAGAEDPYSNIPYDEQAD